MFILCFLLLFQDPNSPDVYIRLDLELFTLEFL